MVQGKKQRCRKSDSYIYIGETEHLINNRIGQHMKNIRKKGFNQTTGHHFNSPGHSVSDMEFTVLEQSESWDLVYRKDREKYQILKFNSYYRGLNRTPE